MSVSINANGETDIKFRMGTTLPVSIVLTYKASADSTGVPMELSLSKFNLIIYDEESGKTKINIPMEVSGSTASCLINYKRRLVARYAVTMTSGEHVTDLVIGSIQVY
jgi:hypothetical protein